MNVGFISLGCSKNLVDTEMVISVFKNNKYNIVNNPKDAEVIVINTCGFIDSAKQEGIDTILEMAEFKKKKCKYLIVIGCLVERYKEEMQKALPEVDLFLSIKEYDNIWEEISKLIEKESKDDKTQGKHFDLNYLDRTITTGETSCYLKIAEGCSNYCTYCAIPYIRGNFISRPFEEIIEEAKGLSKKGIKELIVIAQDTTKYGEDLYGKSRLAELLQELCKIKEFVWIRVLYAYPESITDELIKVVKENKQICNYFDIPIQHISDQILKKMNRKTNGKSIRNILSKIRKEIPDCILRTSLIVGFPGETEREFNELYEFVKEAKFDRLGTFKYSKEEGTPAAKFKNQVHSSTKTGRYNKIMKLQKKIAQNSLKEKIGKEYTALIEGISDDDIFYTARTYMDVPDMDGVIYITNSKDEELKVGQFINVRIIDVNEYDLIGEAI